MQKCTWLLLVLLPRVTASGIDAAPVVEIIL